MHCSNPAICMHRTILAGRNQPCSVILPDVPSQFDRRDNVELELSRLLWGGDATQDPEEVFTKIALRFATYAAGAAPGNKSLDLDVNKASPFGIAAQDVSVRAVAECHHSDESSPA